MENQSQETVEAECFAAEVPGFQDIDPNGGQENRVEGPATTSTISTFSGRLGPARSFRPAQIGSAGAYLSDARCRLQELSGKK